MSDTRPLDGLRVIDLTHVFAGPTCSRILAELGADVIRFESPTRLDVTRNLIITDNDGKDEPWHQASYFVVRNVNKREMCIDIGKPEGLAVMKKLMEDADVVSESFTPRVMAQFGLAYEDIKKIKPDVIMISLSGYGQNGPMRDFGAYGMGLEPASGLSSITGYEGGPPIRTGLSFTDPYSGFVGAGAVLTALQYRRRTGKGQYIDLSEQEAAMPIMGVAFMDAVFNDRDWPRNGNRSAWAAPQGAYRCAGDDRWVAISCTSDAEFERLAGAMGHAEWATDARFATVLARHENHDALDEAITGWTSQQTPYDAMHALQKAGVKAAAVLDGHDVLKDPQYKARGQYDVVDQPSLGKRLIQKHTAARFGRFSTAPRRPSPLIGQHNAEVLKEIGYNDEQIAELESQGIIASKPGTPIPGNLIAAALRLPYDRYVEHGILQRIDPDYREQLGLTE
jgi:benzylsuccinate CoA-transferase BbsF subunit